MVDIKGAVPEDKGRIKADGEGRIKWRKCTCCNDTLPSDMFAMSPHGTENIVCMSCEEEMQGTFDKSTSEEELDRGASDYRPLDGLDIPMPEFMPHVEQVEFDPAKIAASILKRRELARRRLLPFIMEFKRGYSVGWVHKDITSRLERFAKMVERGESPRLMLFMPPRSGKSEIVSRNFPAWFLGRNPELEVIACSYAASLANSFSRKVREILRDPAFKNIFPACSLDKENQAVEQWMTDEGGAYVSAGVGGSIVGKGAHLLIIDDPVKGRDEAQSDTTKESVRDWYTGSAYTRLAPGGGVLIIMQRWAEDDLAGWLLEQDRLNEDEATKENWEVVLYPAIAEADETYRNEGEALHPERYDATALARIRRTVGERDWNALFQQNPLPDTGDYFKEEHFLMVPRSEYPDVSTMNIFAAWDLALTEKDENDPSVGFYVGVCPDRLLWVLHVESCRLTSADLIDRIFELDKIWRPSLTGFEEGHIEKSIGPFFEKMMVERQHFIPFEPLKVGRRDKQMRATTWRGLMQTKQVYWDRNDSTQLAAKAEHLKFPNGKHDDNVDAGAHIGMMCSHLVSKTVKRPAPKKGWREQFLQKMRGVGSASGGTSFMSS